MVCDVWPWVDAGVNATSANITTPHLGQRAKVYFVVCATNGAGAQACYFSDGMSVDLTPPPPFNIIEAPEQPDPQYQSFIDSIVGAALDAHDPDSPIAEVCVYFQF